MAEAFRAAFDREPDDQGRQFMMDSLARRVPRRDLAKHLFQSPERLFVTATRLGF